jgi:hypothetical protein
VIPSKGWQAYETALKEVGENRAVTCPDDLLFLMDLGMVDSLGKLTTRGSHYFTVRFIKVDDSESQLALASAVLDLPPAVVLLQMLDGVPKASKATAESVLRSAGFGEGLTHRKIGTLLSLMQRAGLIRYALGSVKVLTHIAHSDVAPSSVFVSRSTPFANKVWLRRILAECEGHIYWLDKHFLPVAFETLWEVADGMRISRIHVLSLALEQSVNKTGRKMYDDLRLELRSRSIDLEWRTIDSKEMRDTHDRWIIGEKTARNVPDVGTIFSGNNSEMNRSDQHIELNALFDRYWDKAIGVQ